MARRISRRSLIKRGLFGGVLLAGAGGFGLWARGSRLAAPGGPLRVLSPAAYSVIRAIADRLVPPRAGFPRPEEVQVAQKVDDYIASLPELDRDELLTLIALFENALAGFVLDGRITPFTRLPPAAQDRVLGAWQDSRLVVRRSGYQALSGIVLAAYYGSPETYAAVGYPGPPLIPGSGSEAAR